jgi:mono/diheme cytochrome c family protein
MIRNPSPWIVSIFKMTKILATALVACSLVLLANGAQAALFAKGNAEIGAKLHAKTCASCHNSMMPNGKGEELYSEDFRKMTDAGKLKAMVQFCATRTNSGWFDEEIEHVSRYLNDNYYKFTK